MKYYFDTNLAEKVGVDEAIMHSNISYWCEKNEANNINFFDGYYWTYNSANAFSKIFKFWSNRQIERILRNLESKGYIVTGNFNKKAYDKTKWYRINVSPNSESVNVNVGKIDKPLTQTREGPLTQTREPIPDNKHLPNNKPIIINNNAANAEGTSEQEQKSNNIDIAIEETNKRKQYMDNELDSEYLEAIGFDCSYCNSHSQSFLSAIEYIYGRHGLVLDDTTKGTASFIVTRQTKNFRKGQLNSKAEKILKVSGFDSIMELIDACVDYNTNKGEYAKSIGNLYKLKQAMVDIIPKLSTRKVEGFDMFDKFWDMYPKKTGYEKAHREYLKRIKSEEDHFALANGTKKYIIDFDDDIKYMKNPENYIKEGIRKDYDEDKGYDELARVSQLAVEKFEIEILHRYLEEKNGTRQNEEGIELHKSVMSSMRRRAEMMGCYDPDPREWKSLLN